MDSVGEHLTPVPDHHFVLRLAKPSKDFAEKGNILPIQLDEEFNLSTTDQKSTPPHLSVWVESMTTPQQAYDFLGTDSPRKLVLRLNVKETREIQGNCGADTYSNLLDVIWVHLFDESPEKCIRDSRPGADGHSGIIGLDEKSVKSVTDKLTNREQKNLRKDLRSKLAELASKNYFALPH